SLSDLREMKFAEVAAGLAIGLDQFDNLNRVVVAVAEKEESFRLNQWVFVPEQRVNRLALRPHQLPHQQQIGADVVQFADDFVPSLLVNLSLNPIEFAAVGLDDRKVVIDDRIQQGVREEIGT